MTLLTLTMVTALAIGEVVVTTLMDIEFPNKLIPFELPYKRLTLSSKSRDTYHSFYVASSDVSPDQLTSSPSFQLLTLLYRALSGCYSASRMGPTSSKCWIRYSSAKLLSRVCIVLLRKVIIMCLYCAPPQSYNNGKPQVIYPIPSMFIACAEVFAISWIYSIYRYVSSSHTTWIDFNHFKTILKPF